MVPSTASPFGAVLVSLFLLGCGDASLSNSNAGTPSMTVGLSSCVDLAEGEELAGVSPDGRAWLTSVNGLRVVDPDGSEQPVSVRYGAADRLVAWTSERAFVVAESQLWDTRLDNSQPFTLPDNVGRPVYVCGDPESKSGSFILGTRGLFERRGGDWYRWQIPVDVFESMVIQNVEGSCATKDDVMYLTTVDDSLWEVHFGNNPFFRELGPMDLAYQVAVDSQHGLIKLRLGRLYRYEGTWEAIPFDGGFVVQMDAAGGVLWAASGEKLFRRDRFARWEQIEPDTDFVSIDAITAYAAGGAWLTEGLRICHFGHHETVVVDGVRPFERIDEDNPPDKLTIMTDPTASMSLSASVDGRSIEANGVSGMWTLGDLGSVSAGWHELMLNFQSPLGPVQRTVSFRVEGDVVISSGDPTVFWETDVKPIFDTYCALCHGPTGQQRFIGDYESFSASAKDALDLVKSREMPPPPQPGPSQGEIGVIETWIQEGMAP